MNDFRDLKAIAEACQQHQPLRFMRSHGALYIRNDNGIVFDVHQNRSFPEFMAQNKDYADLVLAANPMTVLSLIAENERLRADLDGEMTQARDFNIEHEELKSERDQLKAENEALRSQVQALQANPNSWQSGYDEGRRMGTKHRADEVERLQAEVEALRKDADRWKFVRNPVGNGSPFAIWSEGTKLFLGKSADQAIDAAMGQGEQP